MIDISNQSLIDSFVGQPASRIAEMRYKLASYDIYEYIISNVNELPIFTADYVCNRIRVFVHANKISQIYVG